MSSKKLHLWEVNARPKDYCFYVSREFNTRGQMDGYFHSYALMYAIRNQFHIVSTSNSPQYEELENLEYYCYPAVFENSPKSISHTYNAIHDPWNSPVAPHLEKKNYPIKGQYEKISPWYNEFMFYVLSTSSNLRQPKIIRLGKKLAPISLHWEKLESFTIIDDQDQFFTWPILLEDIDKDKIKGDYHIQFMAPTPIVLYGNTSAKVIEINEQKLVIPRRFIQFVN